MEQNTQQPLLPRDGLRKAREARGWSQQVMAHRIGATFVEVSRWERGLTRPGPLFRKELCLLLEKSEAELDLTR